MAFQYFILMAILFVDLSKSDDSCSQVLSCLEPLEQYDTFTKFIPGADLNDEICDGTSGVFDCLSQHLRACEDNAVAVEAGVIMNEIRFLCRSPDLIRGLRESNCLEEQDRGMYMENLRCCLSSYQDKVKYYVENRLYCRAIRVLKYCPVRKSRPCGQSFEHFYDFLFRGRLRLPRPNGEECYAEYLAADFINNRMLAGSESWDPEAIALPNH